MHFIAIQISLYNYIILCWMNYVCYICFSIKFNNSTFELYHGETLNIIYQSIEDRYYVCRRLRKTRITCTYIYHIFAHKMNESSSSYSHSPTKKKHIKIMFAFSSNILKSYSVCIIILF